MTTECLFCSVPSDRLVASNELAFAIRDRFPVSPGHTLIIVRQHVADWWSTTGEQRTAVDDLITRVKHELDGHYHPAGYNVGFNDRPAAGQTVDHLHIHVIPRYRGDMADPRGGVRHVIPERGNYLSVGEGEATSTLDSADLVQGVLALLDEGRRSATYKPALVLALVELAVERASGPGELVLPLPDVADQVMNLYWPQTRPHEAVHGALKQTTTNKSRIIDALVRLRERTNSREQSLAQVRILHPGEYLAAQRAIARALAKQPIPRLQRPGSTAMGDQYPRLLYDDRGFVAERGWHHAGEPVVVLRAGVAQALAKSAPLIRMATQDVWVREVAAINRLQTQEEQLRAFLFGADRIQLQRVGAGLRDLGATECYWCGGALGRTHEVDHVIPWSRYPNDDLFNLVLSDRECNNNKRARLIAAPLVERWTSRDQSGLASLAGELNWPFAPQRSGQVAASAYRYLPTGIATWAGRDEIRLLDEEDRRRVLVAIEGLVAAA